MLVLIINIISNLGLRNVHFSFFVVRDLKEAQQAQSPKDGHSVPGVSDNPTGLRNAKCLVGGKSAKSSSFTSGQTSP